MCLWPSIETVSRRLYTLTIVCVFVKEVFNHLVTCSLSLSSDWDGIKTACVQVQVYV